MNYEHVCLESFGYVLPEQVLTTADLERQLQPVYDRLRLPEGRLELMTGIQQRRFWPVGTLPSDKSVESGRRAMEAASIDADEIGALIHGSVCRDYLEPATASTVHHRLGLRPDCAVYDVSNACLGILNGILQVANMIELGQIGAGLVVGTESARNLVETTVKKLNDDPTLNRRNIKPAVASLTIGSASAGVLLTHQDISRSQNRLLAAVTRADTQHHELCRSDRDDAIGSGMQPLMNTDSERLMQEGVATGVAAFGELLSTNNWDRHAVQKTVCHQVGLAHRKMLLDQLHLSEENDFPSFSFLGNTGSAALPVTAALAAESGFLESGDSVALLGIGSGINSVMIGVAWQTALVSGNAAKVCPELIGAPWTVIAR